MFTVAVLFAEFGSTTDELTLAEAVMTVPLAVPLFTCTIIVNVAELRPAMFTFVQTSLPEPAPQLHPAGGIMDTNVVFAGMVATSVALSAALGPLLVTTWV
jgi:hypothetical protein